jgi:hypothetical protein
MVLYSIPNLNESFTIAHSIPEIKNGIALIPLLDHNFKLATSENSLEDIVLESKEFLNSAVFVAFNLVPIQENKTDVTLEIRRKKGSFDHHFVTTHSFISIENLITQLSEAIVLTAAPIREV